MKTISVRIVLFTVMCLVPFCSFSAVDDDMYDSELRMDNVFHDEARNIIISSKITRWKW